MLKLEGSGKGLDGGLPSLLLVFPTVSFHCLVSMGMPFVAIGVLEWHWKRSPRTLQSVEVAKAEVLRWAKHCLAFMSGMLTAMAASKRDAFHSYEPDIQRSPHGHC